VVRGKDYVRFSYAGATDDMREAVRRLDAWWQRRSTVR
jgi:aspartate/methionine/tyrosine aminotransferase